MVHNWKITFGIFVALVAASGCNPSTSLRVLQPAQLTVPEHINIVAIVDRSKPSNGWLNVLEGVFTGESIGQDRRSREEAVKGLTNALTRTPRFQIKNTGVEMEGSKAGNNMPPALDWPEVKRICQDYGADALVTIESFDSDNDRTSRRVERKRKDKKTGKETIDVSFDARQRTGVRIGWRMYDPKRQIIFDEYVTDDHLERTASGSTERIAFGNLPSQVSVTRDVAYNVGLEYGHRIAPIYVNVSRTYYGKAKGYKTQMKNASRYLKARELEKAGRIWNEIIVKAEDNKKAAGRAAYNLAVAAEVNGSLDLALEWAQKAWNIYGNKKARNYIQTIKQRQNDARKADSQMPGKKV